jgi:hypothetical protein
MNDATNKGAKKMKVTYDHEYGIETRTSDANNKRADIYADGREVFFGQMICGEFELSRFNPPREFKTIAGARRAANKWIRG